jgi:uncharacterized protein YkwD
MKRHLIYISILLLLFLVSASSVRAMSNSEVVSSINNSRTGNSLSALGNSSALNAAAAQKLSDMQQYKYWGHNNPTTGTSWFTFIRNNGCSGYAAENLARGYNDAGSAVSGWLNSPGHRANMLNSMYNNVGIAIGTVNYNEGASTIIVSVYCRY